MPNHTDRISDEERDERRHNLPMGSTRDGDPGGPADDQGISNRPGDADDPDEFEDDEFDDDEIDPGDVADPKAEPGKPI